MIIQGIWEVGLQHQNWKNPNCSCQISDQRIQSGHLHVQEPEDSVAVESQRPQNSLQSPVWVCVGRQKSVQEAWRNWRPMSRGSSEDLNFLEEKGRFPSFPVYSVQGTSLLIIDVIHIQDGSSLLSSWSRCQLSTDTLRALLIH